MLPINRFRTQLLPPRAEVVDRDLAPAAVYAVNKALIRWENPYQQTAPQPVYKTGAVALFVGDEAPYLWQTALPAALKLLAAAGVTPVLIGSGRNNGYLATSLGFPFTGQTLAQATLDDLAATGARQLLVLSPGDFYTFQTLYEERMGLAWPRHVQLKEVSVYLAERLVAGALAFRRLEGAPPYAYVDPAHSVRVTTRYDAPRQLLAAVMSTPGVSSFLGPSARASAGSTSLKFANPELARHLTYARLGDAAQSGAQAADLRRSRHARRARRPLGPIRRSSPRSLRTPLADHLISDH